jgi:hypothetical protein
MTAHALHHLASVSVQPAACGRWAVELPTRYAPSKGHPPPNGSLLTFPYAGNAHPFSVVVSK